MNRPVSNQQIFLRSILAHSIENATENLRIRLTDREENDLFVIESTEDAHFYARTSENKSAQHLQPDHVVEWILSHWGEAGEALYIDDGAKITRLQLKGDRLIRETLPERPKVKNALWSIGKATHLDPHEAAPLLQAIGLMTEEGEIKAPMRKKFKQVNHFLELLSPLLEKNSTRSITLVDCGCGKSYLSFVLFWYLTKTLKRKARFVGIDASKKLIEDCKEKAKKLALQMEFQCSPIIQAALPDQIDLLVSLHACNTATDEALACGIAHKAQHIAAAPCCQHEIAEQLEAIPHYPLAKHGLFKQRFGELLTDMMRSLCLEAHGYTVTVGEFISSEETPKNLLIRASRGNANFKQRMLEYEDFKNFYRISPALDYLLLEREALSKSQ